MENTLTNQEATMTKQIRGISIFQGVRESETERFIYDGSGIWSLFMRRGNAFIFTLKFRAPARARLSTLRARCAD